MNQLSEMRREKDEFFAHHPHSPLMAEQLKHFIGLQYYPYEQDLVFELEINKFENVEEMEIQTSTGEIQFYQRYGSIIFEVEGQTANLTIFKNEHGLFLPFVDAGAGEETYPAGRYLEPEILANGQVLVNFNLAYNPYCAYNDAWSCPLTPFENRLKVNIRAGEKIFDKVAVND